MGESKIKTKIIGVIPARYASTRFPGKVLTLICNKPMVQWVYERAAQASSLDDLVIATDDVRIQKKVLEFGGNAVMTSPEHVSGTDRVAEAATNMDADVIVNIQGDEPLISPQAIDEVVAPFIYGNDVQMTTLCRQAKNVDEMVDYNKVRVVFDQNNHAMYFSRASIPHNREKEQATWLEDKNHYVHIGIYAYKKSFLKYISDLPQTPLESIERLEQLRVLESGHRIGVIKTHYDPVCVDIPEDVEVVERIMKTKG